MAAVPCRSLLLGFSWICSDVCAKFHLDIVVEHQVLLLVSHEQLDGVLRLEVLELDESGRPAQLDGSHELVWRKKGVKQKVFFLLEIVYFYKLRFTYQTVIVISLQSWFPHTQVSVNWMEINCLAEWNHSKN